MPFLCGLYFSCFLRSRERQQNAKVKAVLPDGQLAEWNKINPDSAIRPYDACPNLAKLSIPYAFSSEFSESYRIDIFVNESKLPFKDKIFKVNGKERKSRAAAWTTNTETLKFSPFLPAGRYSSRTRVFHRVFKPGPEPCLENPCKGKIVCVCHMLCQFCEFVSDPATMLGMLCNNVQHKSHLIQFISCTFLVSCTCTYVFILWTRKFQYLVRGHFCFKFPLICLACPLVPHLTLLSWMVIQGGIDLSSFSSCRWPVYLLLIHGGSATYRNTLSG